MNLIIGILKNGPYEFILDSINGKIIVMAIIEGGIIHEHGKFGLLIFFKSCFLDMQL